MAFVDQIDKQFSPQTKATECNTSAASVAPPAVTDGMDVGDARVSSVKRDCGNSVLFGSKFKSTFTTNVLSLSVASRGKHILHTYRSVYECAVTAVPTAEGIVNFPILFFVIFLVA